MKEIKIHLSDKIALVDDEDYERISQYKWWITEDGCVTRNYKSSYRTRHVSMAAEIMHQRKQLFDHKDRNGLNNQKHNLREATSQQNAFNRSKRSGCSSQYKGVSKRGIRWRASIKFNGKNISLGMFRDEIEAARAYDKAAVELFKEFAYLNNV